MAKTRKKDARDTQARRGIAALAVLVTALVALVVWASSKGSETDAGAGGATAEDAGETDAAAETARRRADRVPHAAEVTADLTILTGAGDDAIAKATARDALARGLDIATCGTACDGVKALVQSEEGLELETVPGDELILPPKDTLDTVAPGLTAAQRASVHERRAGIVVRVRGPATKEQLPARTLFAVSAVLARALDGLVWDETTRRIEDADGARARAITTPRSAPAWNPRTIVIQFYRQADGTARLITLGMARFGAPDLVLSGASMAAGALLVDVMNAVARSVIAGDDALPIAVAPSDVHRTDAGGAPVLLEAVAADRAQGDADNDLVELVPPVGVTREGWDDVVDRLFGDRPHAVETKFDAELEAAAQRSRAELPRALARRDAGEGELFVWAPFRIPEDERADGGPEEEWLWVKVSTCDEGGCTGTLSNRPMYASNIASGRTTRVPRAKIADWMLRLPDGGLAGGKTTALVERRQER